MLDPTVYITGVTIMFTVQVVELVSGVLEDTFTGSNLNDAWTRMYAVRDELQSARPVNLNVRRYGCRIV